ncbi:DUF262 domain-containing protein [Rhizobacter sp. J219]|uniref:DUF262 domain-containing protein n=1 Tax=Rhizobacter sp. J219 TaxID=2898430 RepID=UPI002150D47A|nr:DUF262 domain-containing protein [Rhizobacter sp. J219]MCR5881542.1 DUF262 domain-containing protein [Rhizobacter sp. J219]
MATDTKDLAEELEQSEAEPLGAAADAESSDEAIEDQIVKQPFRVIYQTNNFFLPQIKDLIKAGEDVNLRPEYQRRLRWTTQQKSLLIESLLLNVPVPPVFFYENDLARYEVMDGQQRLSSIKEFLNNEYSLRGLQIIPTLNGKNYARLPTKVKRSLDRASISAIVLLQESQGKLKRPNSNRVYELRRFVFERLNTGGKRLTAQEIRNAVYGGEFNNLIVTLSRNATFTRIWGIPPYVENDYGDYYEDEERQKNSLYRTMGDCQLVLRYFALDNDAHIVGSLRSMLDRCMERNLSASKEECAAFGETYLKVLSLADAIFDGRPFSLSPDPNEYRPLAGIYDGVMVALGGMLQHGDTLVDKRIDIQTAYHKLVNAKGRGQFTGVASTAQDVKGRIAEFRKLFASFL